MKKLFVAIGITAIVAFIVLVLNINEKLALQKQVKIYDNISKVLTTTINNEKTSLLSFTIAYSKSRAIQDVVLDHNRSLGHYILSANAKMLKKHINKQDVYIQIIEKDLSPFARSWEKEISKTPMVTGRKTSLRKLIQTSSPKTGIDIGLPFGIRASSVISYKNNFLGVLESITPYDVIVSKMRAHQIEIIPLINRNFVPLCYVEKKKLTIFNDKWVVANQNINNRLAYKLHSLSGDDFSKLLQSDFLLKDSHMYLSYPIISIDNIKLGTFIAIVEKSDLVNFIGREKSIIQSIYTLDSSRDDIYHLAKKKEQRLFSDMQNEYIVGLIHNIDNKDFLDFEETAKEKLNDMTKEELINMLLYRYTRKEIRGEIR